MKEFFGFLADSKAPSSKNYFWYLTLKISFCPLNFECTSSSVDEENVGNLLEQCVSQSQALNNDSASSAKPTTVAFSNPLGPQPCL